MRLNIHVIKIGQNERIVSNFLVKKEDIILGKTGGLRCHITAPLPMSHQFSIVFRL